MSPSSPSRARRTCQAIFFLLPLAIILGIPLSVLWLGGEFIDPEKVVSLQMDDTRLVLHGPAYTNSATYVKARLQALRRPQVVALGNSRVLQFRREFFLPDIRFYNAGGSVARIRNFRAFLECLPREALPETLLIATDTSYFNLSFDKVDRDGYAGSWVREQLEAHSSPTVVFQTRWRDVWKDMRAGKIKYSRLFSLDGWSTRVGLNALSNNAGFRNDGSYRYNELEQDISNPRHHDYQFARTLHAVSTGDGRFPWGEKPSDEAVGEMEKVLDFCIANRIHLIGFMPPHAHAVWAAMQALGDRYAYIPALESEMRKRFEDRGFEFYNFSDLASFGAPDTEATDGYHGSERAYLRLFISMLEQGSQLNACANLEALRQALATTPEQGNVFPDL